MTVEEWKRKNPPIQRKSKTKADRIRAMTDEELAEFIGRDPMNDICPNNCENDRDRPCRVCALDWLRQEVEEGE